VWLNALEISLALIPINDNLLNGTRRLRKALRDVRDRSARHDRRFATVAMAGLVGGDRALVLVQHPGIDRAEVWRMLERRWPEVTVTDPGDIIPTSVMTVEDAAALARRKRGVEPIRIIIAPQAAARTDPWGEPMPLLV
jgi:hypothetical protein